MKKALFNVVFKDRKRMVVLAVSDKDAKVKAREARKQLTGKDTAVVRAEVVTEEGSRSWV